MAFQTPPVSDLVLPPKPEEDRRDHLRSRGVFVVELVVAPSALVVSVPPLDEDRREAPEGRDRRRLGWRVTQDRQDASVGVRPYPTGGVQSLERVLRNAAVLEEPTADGPSGIRF